VAISHVTVDAPPPVGGNSGFSINTCRTCGFAWSFESLKDRSALEAALAGGALRGGRRTILPNTEPAVCQYVHPSEPKLRQPVRDVNENSNARTRNIYRLHRGVVLNGTAIASLTRHLNKEELPLPPRAVTTIDMKGHPR
jgi:hypothetical protein